MYPKVKVIKTVWPYVGRGGSKEIQICVHEFTVYVLFQITEIIQWVVLITGQSLGKKRLNWLPISHNLYQNKLQVEQVPMV